MTDAPIPGITPGNWGQQLLDYLTDQAPGVELAYDERTTTFTTTNTSIGSTAAASKVTGLSISVVGTGRPVRIDFQASVHHSVASTAVFPYILRDGVYVRLGSVSSPQTGTGRTLYFFSREVLTDGVTYTYEVGVAGGAAGTSTLSAAAEFPITLTATQL